MSQRKITVPADVVAAEGAPKLPTFPQVVSGILDGSETFAKGRSGIALALRIEKAFDGKVGGDVVILDHDDWSKLDEAIEKMQFNPAVMRKCASYLDAIHEAEKVD